MNFIHLPKNYRGTVSPILLSMIEHQALQKVVEDVLETFGGFLVEIIISPSNQITVHADHPRGISLHELSLISKAIDENFDRDVEDFELEVSSPGMSNPIRVLKQYHRFLGRQIRVLKNSGEVIVATLKEADEEKITLIKIERVPKTIGKGKVDQTTEWTLPFTEFKETRLEF